MLKRTLWLCVFSLMGCQPPDATSGSEIVLYSSNDVQTVSYVVSEFEKQNPGLSVLVVRAGSGALMRRIKAEASNPLGDIFWSGGLSTIAAFPHQFQPYALPKVTGAFESSDVSAIPAQYRSANDLWHATNVHLTVLMSNIGAVPNGKLPKRWSDLAGPEWHGKVVIPDPHFSSASYVALFGLRQLLGDEVYARIVRNAVFVGSTSAAYQGVASGEFAAAVTMEYAAYQYIAGGLKGIRLVYPSDGTFQSPEGMALIKGAKHLAGARRLFEFLASKPAQIAIFKSAYRRPARTDINVSTLSSLPTMNSIKVIPQNDAYMASERATFLKHWDQLVSLR